MESPLRMTRFTARAAAFCLAALLAAGCGGGSSYVPTASSDAGLLPDSKSKTTSISACTTVSKSGTYNVTADLTSTSQPGGPACILVQNASNVTLNCQKHVITAASPAVEFNNVTGFTIENCNLISDNSSGNTGEPSVLLVQSSSKGTVTNNTAAPSSSLPPPLYATVDIVGSANVTVTSNTFQMSTFATHSSGTLFSKNNIACSLRLGDCTALIGLTFGTSDQAVGNTLDGMTALDTLQSNPVGTDDGILLWVETSAVVKNNTIKNVYDCGLETYGPVSGATVTGNAFSNVTNCGLGGWYYLHLTNSTFANNTVSGSHELFAFFRIEGLAQPGSFGPGSPAETGVYFSGNTFEKNTLSGAFTSQNFFAANTAGYIPFESGGQFMAFNDYGNLPDPTPSQFHLAGNVFSGNDFGKVGLVYLGDTVVPGAVIDKGGNRCKPYPEPNFPIACGAP
jgi:hypothetical protein